MRRLCFGMALLVVNPASLHFIERGSEAGFVHPLQFGGAEKKWIMEANGGGVAVLDYDQDGFMDIVVVNGSSVAQLAKLLGGESAGPRADGVFLYRNTRDG